MKYRRTAVIFLVGSLFFGHMMLSNANFSAAINAVPSANTGNNGSTFVTNDIINIAVPVSGVRNVNDLTTSDYKLTIELLEQANKHYDKEDGLTEFFFTKNGERKVDNLPTSISWLINNNIINRDSKISVIQSGNTFPQVTLDKEDIESKLLSNTTKTEFISALYRSVFGVIQSRGIGLHFTGFRNVDGNLEQFTEYTYDYKPQAEYILKNYIEDATIEVNNYLDLDVIGGTGGSGGDGGTGGPGGDANVDISVNGKIETYQFQPAGDIMYYFTNDISELYISAAMNKGILSQAKDNIKQTFIEQHNKSTVQSGKNYYVKWDSRLHPLIYGEPMELRSTAAELDIGSSAFGSGYTITGTSNSYTITKVSEDNETSALFTDEYSLTKMDVYTYIYRFISSSEKVLSELESDIISYKYSARFDNLVKSEDIDILQFLTAKGIIDFEDSSSYENLYTSISWGDTYELLYRVANKDARLNFTEIQLTDTDQYWQQKGYSAVPITVDLTGTEGNLKTIKSGTSQASTVELKQSDTFFGSLYNVLFLGETGYEAKYETANFNTLGLNKINFNTELLALSDSTLQELVKESLLVASKKQGTISSELCKKIVSEAGDNFSITGISSATASLTAYERVLGNIFILYKYDNIANDLKANYKDLYDAYKKDILSFPSMLAGSASNGTSMDGVTGLSQISLNISGTTLNQIFSTTSSNRINYVKENMTGISLVYNGKNILSLTKDVNGTAASLVFYLKASSENNAAVIARSMLKEYTGSNSTGITAYTQNQTSNNSTNTVKSLVNFFVEKQTYVSLTQIQSVYPNIIRISDTILQNTLTGSYAYIHPETRTALVGTEIMTTIEEPIIKDSGELSYDLNLIIRLLPCSAVKQLDTKKILSIPVESPVVAQENENTPLLGADISGQATVTTVNAINTLNTAGDPSDTNTQVDNTYGTPNLSNAGHNTYVYAPTIDGGTNVIYKYLSHNNEAYALAVLRFIPDTSSSLSVNMPDNPTLSEMMSFVGTVPTSTEGKAIWDRNISLSNLYANWMYGTSDIEYLKTGLLRPSMTIILLNDTYENQALSALSTLKGIGQQKSLAGLQNIIIDKYKVNNNIDNQLFLYTKAREITGAFWSTKEEASNGETAYGNLSSDNYATYYVSDDKNYIIYRGRVYFSVDALSGIIPTTYNGSFALQTTSSVTPSMMWDIGQNLKIKTTTTNGKTIEETATVIAKQDNYAVVQLAPITGIPIFYQNDGTMKVLSSTATGAIDIKTGDLIQNKVQLILNTYSGVKQDTQKILVDNPLGVASIRNKDRCIVTQNKVFFVPKAATKSIASIDPTYFKYEENMTFTRLQEKVNASIDKTISSLSSLYKDFSLEKDNGVYLAEAYPQVLIPMTEYVISNGYLVNQKSVMSQFMPPLLYSSLNRYIVDALINESIGAIPVNEIPDGAILSINNGMYVAKTENSEKKFIGLTDIGFLTNMNIVSPTVVDLCKSFASCMINCGNQYLNITQYFNSIGFGTITGTSSELTTLKKLINNDFDYYSLNNQGNVVRSTTRAIGPQVGQSNSNNIKPISVYGTYTFGWTTISFEDGLLAFKISSDDTTPIYSLLSHSDTVVYGDLTDIPFFSDKALESNILDKTTELSSAGFRILANANAFMDLIKQNFEAAFKGDLYTLFRLIMFCILSWLLIASWICYALRLSRLEPILELIKYPTGERNARGVDLLKIISLGTISLETDFKLARFFMYDSIIAVLILVVWRIG